MQQLRKGDILLRRGDALRGAALVVSGRLRVYTISAEGDEATLYHVGPGESCPLAMHALLSEHRHQAWVAADSPSVRLYVIPTVVYRNLYENEPSVRSFTVEVLSRRIASLTTALEALSLHPLRERLLTYLAEHAGPRGEVAVTHREIALALGTAREVITREIAKLRQSGGLRTRRRQIILVAKKRDAAS